MEKLYEYSLRMSGASKVLVELLDFTENIEMSESNGARRYKLLKYCIKRLRNDRWELDKFLYKKEFSFKYKFEKGKLIITDDEVKGNILDREAHDKKETRDTYGREAHESRETAERERREEKDSHL